MSQLAEIMSALADVTVTVTHDGTTYNITGLTHDDDNFSVVRDTPIRVISPITEESDTFEFLTLNASSGRWTYRLTDLLLLRSATSGTGIEDDATWLAKYKSAYAGALLANRKLGLNNVSIVNVASAEAGVYAYPVDSVQQYNGVKIELIISEVVFA